MSDENDCIILVGAADKRDTFLSTICKGIICWVRVLIVACVTYGLTVSSQYLAILRDFFFTIMYHFECLGIDKTSSKIIKQFVVVNVCRADLSNIFGFLYPYLLLFLLLFVLGVTNNTHTHTHTHTHVHRMCKIIG